MHNKIKHKEREKIWRIVVDLNIQIFRCTKASDDNDIKNMLINYSNDISQIIADYNVPMNKNERKNIESVNVERVYSAIEKCMSIGKLIKTIKKQNELIHCSEDIIEMTFTIIEFLKKLVPVEYQYNE